MQNILLFFKRPTANATPTDMTAGSAGGTVIVIKSSDLSTRFAVVVSYSIIAGNEIAKPIIVKQAMKPTKIRESL